MSKISSEVCFLFLHQPFSIDLIISILPMTVMFHWNFYLTGIWLYRWWVFPSSLKWDPKTKIYPQGKHNAVSQSPIQNSSPLHMFSPAKLICLKYNCKLIKRFLTGDLILHWRTMEGPPRWCHTSAREEAGASLLYILKYKAAFHSFPPAPT